MARTRSAKQAETSVSNLAPSSVSKSSKGLTGTGGNIEDYDDQSSSYWPEGWNLKRYINAAQTELFALPDGELGKLLAGFKDVLGEDGNLKMAQALERYENEKRKQQQEDQQQSCVTSKEHPVYSVRPSFAALVPNWLQFYRRFQGQEWGFVAFKVGRHEDESKWSEFKEKFETIVRLPIRTEKQMPGVQEADEHFRIKWVEDAELERANAKQIQDKLATITPTLPVGMAQQLCLAATPRSVTHLLDAPTPNADSRRWRPDPPYVLAISASHDPGLEEGHEERELFRETFKVATETLVDELWTVLVRLEWPVRRITREIKGVRLVDGEETETEDSEDARLEDVWWSSAPSPQRLRERRRVE